MPLLTAYENYRFTLGRVLLLGIEFLVAADIIRTATVDLSLSSVGALGLLIIVRAILSISLDMEVEGRLPWARRTDLASGDRQEGGHK